MAFSVLYIFLVCSIYILVARANACTTEMDCLACHQCVEGTCQPVEAGTDPIGECPMLCGVKLVCGKKQVCVYQHPPTCVCNWLTGGCMEYRAPPSPSAVASTASLHTTTSTEPLQVVLNPPDMDMIAMGYSDDDIRMLIELFRQENEIHHGTRTPSITPMIISTDANDNTYQKYVYILIAVQEVIPLATFLLVVIAAIYFRQRVNVNVTTATPIKKTS